MAARRYFELGGEFMTCRDDSGPVNRRPPERARSSSNLRVRMPKVSESTKANRSYKLRARARERWPALASVEVPTAPTPPKAPSTPLAASTSTTWGSPRIADT